jgi:hypothetical protein
MNHFDPDLLFKHFGKEDGYVHVLTSLYRLYTQLPDFDVTHAGLYGYFRSWRNSTDQDKLNTVWHSKKYMYAQTGLGRTAFNARLKVLIKYGLITPIESELVPHKQIYYVHDPLPRDQFIEKYSVYVNEFFEKAEKIEKENAEDRERRREIAMKKLKTKVAELSAENQQRL